MQTDRPAISVLLPVRDGAAHLAACLASLAAQTFEDYELVLEDDGSSDATPRLVAQAAAADPRIRAARSAGGEGLVAALSRAAARARGDLFVRMDADDVAHPERFARIVQSFAKDHALALLGSRTRYIGAGRLSPGWLRYERWLNGVVSPADIVASRFIECPLPHPTWAMRRSAFVALGGYREGPFPEDYDFFLRACAAGLRLAKLPEVLLLWRRHEDNSSRRDPRYSLAAFRRLKAAYLAETNFGSQPCVVVGAPRTTGRWLRDLAAAGCRRATTQAVWPAEAPPGTLLLLAPPTGASRADWTRAAMLSGRRLGGDAFFIQ